MPLLHKLHRRGHIIRHPQPRHHNPQPPPRQPTNPHLPLHLAQFIPLAQNPHIVQLLQHQFLMLDAYRVRRLEGCEGVRELAQGAADAVVFGVVGGGGDGVAAADGGGVVVGVGFVGREVDLWGLSEERGGELGRRG